jgi:hypothetical protein
VELAQGLERIHSRAEQQYEQAAVPQSQNSSQSAERRAVVWIQILFLVRRCFCIPLLGVHCLNKTRLLLKRKCDA